MKVLKVILILLLPVFLFSSYIEKSSSKDFYIIFGSGFRNDTVSLIVNEEQVIDNIVLQSDSIGDISREISIHFKTDTLFVLNKTLKIIKRIPFQYDKNLKMIIKINNRPYHLMADLNKGKYITISKHWYYFNVYLNQYKKPISLE